MAPHLADADWLILACPLTDTTRGCSTGTCCRAFRTVNVARGAIMVERDLEAGLRSKGRAGQGGG